MPRVYARVALATGWASGIGLAAAKALPPAAPLALTDSDRKQLAALSRLKRQKKDGSFETM